MLVKLKFVFFFGLYANLFGFRLDVMDCGADLRLGFWRN